MNITLRQLQAFVLVAETGEVFESPAAKGTVVNSVGAGDSAVTSPASAPDEGVGVGACVSGDGSCSGVLFVMIVPFAMSSPSGCRRNRTG